MNPVVPLILGCVMLVTLGQLCFRIGARHDDNEHAGLRGFLEVVARPVVWLGVAAFLTQLCLWMLVLERVDLSVAYPMMSLDYVMVTLCSAFYLGERVRRKRWAGVAFIVIGVVLIGSQ